MIIRQAAVAAFLSMASIPSGVMASAFSIEHQNARAMGAAYAGAEARSADAGYAYYNPAAIAGLKRPETSSSAIMFWGKSAYENAQAVLLGFAPAPGLSADDGVLSTNVIPSSAFAFPVNDRLTLGLTMTSPFGLKSDFAADSAVRYYAQNANLLTIAVSPTAAFEVAPWLSIGASLKIEYMNLTASTVVDAGGIAFLKFIPGYAPGSSDLFAEFKGDDIAFGYTAGFQAKPSEALTIGFSYASRVTHKFTGGVTFDIAGSSAAQALNAASGIFAASAFDSALPLPAAYRLGAQLAATHELRLLGSVGLMRWSTFDQIVFTFDNPAQPPELITSNWKDSWSFAVGAEYDLSNRTTIRAGWKLDQTPVTDAGAGPRIPDSDHNWATAGFTRQISDKASFDIAGGVVFNADRPIALTGAAPGDFLRGALTADFKIHTYSIGGRLRYRF